MRGIFFIVGTGRSGTYLCNTMLNLHPEILAVTETHFIRTLVRLFGTDVIAFGEFFRVIDEHYTSEGTKKWTHFHLEAGGRNPATFRSDFQTFCSPTDQGTVRHFVEAFFHFCYGGEIYLLGDKTPLYGMHMSAFLELWPNAKFIHMIRDGRYAATSMKNHEGFVRLINAGFPDKVSEYSYKKIQTSFSTAPVSLLDCLKWWKRIVIAIRKESKRIPSDVYLEIHYEDLIMQPVRELWKMARFLGVPIDLRWLLKASLVPRPFSIWRQTKRLSRLDYELMTAEGASTLKELGYGTRSYPYAQFIRIKYGIKETVRWFFYKLILRVRWGITLLRNTGVFNIWRK